MKLKINLALIILFMASFQGCRKPNSNDDGDASISLNQSQNDEFSRPVPLTMDPETKRWWISKANRTLRLSKSFQSMKDTADLESLPAEEIIDRMQNTKDFYDMVADFTSYWIGNKDIDIWANNYGGNATHISYSFARNNSAVINTVKRFYEGQDYFGSLFSSKGSPINAGYSPAYLPGGNTNQISDAEIRTKIQSGFWKNKQNLIDRLQANDVAGFCKTFFDDEAEFTLADIIFNIGGAFNINFDAYMQNIVSFQLYCRTHASFNSEEMQIKLNQFEASSDLLIAGANEMQLQNSDVMTAFAKNTWRT